MSETLLELRESHAVNDPRKELVAILTELDELKAMLTVPGNFDPHTWLEVIKSKARAVGKTI